MLRNYIDGTSSRGQTLRRAGLARPRAPHPRGFSLVELLTVIVIITILMTAANGLFTSPGSRSVEPASRIARGIELARAQATARNRSIAIRFDWIDNRETAMRFLWQRPGQPAGTLSELRRSERLTDIAISPRIGIPTAPNAANGANSTNPSLPAHHLDPSESLVVTPDGQIFVGTGRQGFPTTSDTLQPTILVGIQPTRDGRTVRADRRDTATVEIQCATGTARVLPQ